MVIKLVQGTTNILLLIWGARKSRYKIQGLPVGFSLVLMILPCTTCKHKHKHAGCLGSSLGGWATGAVGKCIVTINIFPSPSFLLLRHSWMRYTHICIYVHICLQGGSGTCAKSMVLDIAVLHLTDYTKLLTIQLPCPQFWNARHVWCSTAIFYDASLEVFWKMNYWPFLEWLWKGCSRFDGYLLIMWWMTLLTDHLRWEFKTKVLGRTTCSPRSVPGH